MIGNSLFKPRVVVSVPAMHTDVEKRTIVSVMIHAGARSVCLVEEPLCAAFGAGIDPMQPSGAFVIDLGGGTVDMAVISQGAMSQSESLKVGGNDLDAEIVKFLREEHNVAVGLRTAEEIKRTVACALPREEDVTTYAKGQDLLTGLPREVEISGNALYLALQPYFETVAEHAGALFERTSPQLVTDIGNTGVLLTGGGANICNMDRLFRTHWAACRCVRPRTKCTAWPSCVVALEKCIFWISTAIGIRPKKMPIFADGSVCQVAPIGAVLFLFVRIAAHLPEPAPGAGGVVSTGRGGVPAADRRPPQSAQPFVRAGAGGAGGRF